LRHENLTGQALFNLAWGSALKEQFERLAEIVSGFFDRVALARDVQLWAKGDETRSLALDDCGQSPVHINLQ
jgi:hypothetical protein